MRSVILDKWHDFNTIGKNVAVACHRKVGVTCSDTVKFILVLLSKASQRKREHKIYHRDFYQMFDLPAAAETCKTSICTSPESQ